MKKNINKDNSIDYIFTEKEFQSYLVGCLTHKQGGFYTVRVYGPVKDMSKTVIRKKLG